MSLKKNSKGFTLIELMIVVAIIGILAAVAVPKFADLVTKSKEASIKGSLGTVRSALSIYYGDTEGVYPGDLFNALVNDVDGDGTVETGEENKYLPAVAGLPSLGRFEIPAHSTVPDDGGTPTGNEGHSGTFWSNASGTGAVVPDADDDAPIVPTDASPLMYGDAGSILGEVYVNCDHVDTKGQRWTSY